MTTRTLLALIAVLGLAACAEAPDAPSPEGTASPVETPVETAPGQRTTPAATAVGGEPGVPGSDRPEEALEVGSGARCYVYPRYVVRVRPRTGAPGEDVLVFARAEGDVRAQCEASPGGARFSILDSGRADHFFGLVGDRLLLDKGTGPSGRTVRVVDLASGAAVHEAVYEEPILVEDGALVYGMEPEIARTMEEVQELGVACPEAAAWFDQGLAVGLSPEIRYDFAGGAAEPTGEVVCVPIQ